LTTEDWKNLSNVRKILHYGEFMKEDHRRVDKGVEDNEISGIRSRQNFTGCSSTAKVVNMGYEGNVDKKIGHSLSKTILDHPRL
jgi:hypothetical protein